jgi:hypothetical protein
MGVLTAGQAQALVVNVGGQDWDVTTFTGSYNGNSSKFATPANGGIMPWWNNNTLAQQFATAVAASFGDPGPQFGYEIISLGFPIFSNAIATWFYDSANPNLKTQGSFFLTASHLYAAATVVTPAPAAPVPGPLPAIGAAAAFGFSRRLRKRIKASTNAIPNTFIL